MLTTLCTHYRKSETKTSSTKTNDILAACILIKYTKQLNEDFFDWLEVSKDQMIKSILREMDEGEDPNNYKTTPLVGDELGFASNIIKKHFEKNKIFLLSTVQLSLYHMGKQKLKDENKKLQMIIKKQQLETITAETQKGLENIPKIDDVETLTKIIDQQTKANIKRESTKLEKKIINNRIFKTLKKATGGGQNPNTKARKNGTSSKGSSRKQQQNQKIHKKN